MVFVNDPSLPTRRRGPCVGVGHAAADAYTDRQWQRRGHVLTLGLGIAHGYATPGMIGFEVGWIYAAIGPVTNLAARLLCEARGGQILISQRVYVVLEELLEAEPLGEILSGLSATVPVFM